MWHSVGVALLLIYSFLAAAPAVAQAEKRIALLIGNQAYDTSVGKLKEPTHNDIAIVGQALAAQGFELIPPIKDASRTAILGGVRELRAMRRRRGPGRQREALPEAEGQLQGLPNLPRDGRGSGGRIHNGVASK